uniref:Putative salivary secreted peptide n=1 Tax=Ixodes ricinus TaxID=34613 RepID=V5HGK9_IXORI
MEVKWMLAYFLLSSSLVFGIATKVETSSGKTPPNSKNPASSNGTPTQKETAASTSTQAKPKEASPKTTAAPQPSAPRPSTDPIICGLTEDWNKYMEKSSKNVSGLLNDICEAGKNGTNPDFMANYTENDKAMVYDTSTLCRIRHTTKSACEIPNLIE